MQARPMLSCGVRPSVSLSVRKGKKVKEVDLYSAFITVPHTQGAQIRITQCYLQITPYLPLPRKHSPDGVSPDWGCAHLIAAYYSFIYPRKDERLSRPDWLTHSGRFPHISGHPSVAGRALDSESSPVRDRRSTTVPRNQLRPSVRPSVRPSRSWILSKRVIVSSIFFHHRVATLF